MLLDGQDVIPRGKFMNAFVGLAPLHGRPFKMPGSVSDPGMSVAHRCRDTHTVHMLTVPFAWTQSSNI